MIRSDRFAAVILLEHKTNIIKERKLRGNKTSNFLSCQTQKLISLQITCLSTDTSIYHIQTWDVSVWSTILLVLKTVRCPSSDFKNCKSKNLDQWIFPVMTFYCWRSTILDKIKSKIGRGWEILISVLA